MKHILSILLFVLVLALPLHSERIYIANSPGYNTAEPQLIAAIVAKGHVVDVNLVPPTSLPAGFTSRCSDPVNGYDWLLLFGAVDYSPLLPQIQAFIDSGGKVFCQYEVSCCVPSSIGTAAILSGLTGLSIVPNVEDYIALGLTTGAWECNNLGGCLPIVGNAYKGLDGVPVANQFQATGSTGEPSHTVCTNFGFHFETTDFAGTAHNGAITGLGDINSWYDGDEPFLNGGSTPVNTALVSFFFPADCSDTCYLFPPGCILETPPVTSVGCTLDFGNDTLMCTGNTLTLHTVAGGASTTYLWQDGSTNSTFNVSAPGLYWVLVNSACCGTVSDSIVVTYVQGVEFDLGNDTILCNGVSLELDASCHGLSYEWQNGSTDSTFTVTTDGIYWVKVATACGTFEYDSIAVGYFMDISVDLGPDQVLCPGQTTVLSALTWGVLTYEWQDGSDSSALVVSQPGEYWVEINSECYTHRDTVEINYVGPQLFDLGTPDTVLCKGHNLLIGPQPVTGINYLWQDGNTSSTYFVTQEGIYSLTAQITGCAYTDSVHVIYVDCDPVVWVPNVFTPNGDGDNDVFRPVFTELVDTYQMRIFDRWGKELFSTLVPEQGWNGNFNGKPCSEGTYFWTLQYTGGLQGNKSGEQHGSLVLAR